jgi:hypothetical protein
MNSIRWLETELSILGNRNWQAIVEHLGPNSKIIFFLLKKLVERNIITEKDALEIIGSALK